MGFIKDAKAENLALQARKATEAGRRVFAARLNMPTAQAGNFSGEIVDWSMMIEAIEGEGWTLAEWSTASDSKGRAEVHALFRRL